MAKNNSEGLAGLLSAMLTQYAALQNADSSTDSKANNLMAAALVIVPLLGTQLTDGLGHWNWLVVVAMAIMVLTTPLVVYITRSRQYAGAVVDLDTRRDYFTMNNDLLLAQLIEDVNQANVTNSGILEGKQRVFRWTVFIFLAGFALGILSLFLVH